MSDDLAPQHGIEIGYLRELVTAINVAFNLEESNEYTRVLDGDLLAEWRRIHRRQLINCPNTRHDIRFMADRNPHYREIKAFDDLVDNLKDGLANGNLATKITLEDIKQAERGCEALETCLLHTGWGNFDER